MSTFQRGWYDGYVINGTQLNNFKPRLFVILPRVNFTGEEDPTKFMLNPYDSIAYNNKDDTNK